MLAKERLAYVVKRLQVQPSISIQELSKEMNVSFSTVQRDLRKLEQNGSIERSRGGAISKQVSEMLSGMNEIAVSEKIHLNEPEKDRIAITAAKYIHDGDCIFLDSGTTIAYLVPYIRNRNITIVTNSTYLHRKLIGCRCDVFLLGGMYHPKFDMTLGASTLMQLENLRFNCAFLSASGIDMESRELYVVESEIAMIKKMVIRRSEKNYVVADHTKFHIKAMHTYAKLSEINKIMTDAYEKKGRLPKEIILCS